jgi:hypothetical protein
MRLEPQMSLIKCRDVSFMPATANPSSGVASKKSFRLVVKAYESLNRRANRSRSLLGAMSEAIGYSLCLLPIFIGPA